MPAAQKIAFILHSFTQGPAMRRAFAHAKQLSQRGHAVTLFAHETGGVMEEGDWQLVTLPKSCKVTSDANPSLQAAYETWLWLRTQTFDQVHFMGEIWLGYYALLGRGQGLALTETTFLVHDESPAMPAMNYAALETQFMSDCARKMADRSVAANEPVESWLNQRAKLTPPVRQDNPPLVTVCMAHYNRPFLLQRAIESLEQQDYPNLEVIVVDDGSTDADTAACLNLLERRFAPRGWQVVRQENKYLGAARNTAARHARGDYLLFMDDDNIALPHEVSTFVHAARHSGADILTTVMQRFDEEPDQPTRLHIPLGGCIETALFENCYGDANALIRRSVFEAIGGFTEEVGVGLEDMELFTKAVLKGYRLEVVPEPLFYYRDSAQSMIHSTSRVKNGLRALRPLQAAYPALAGAMAIAHEAYVDAHKLVIGVQESEAIHLRLSKEWERTRATLEKDFTLLKMDRDQLHAEYQELARQNEQLRSRERQVGEDLIGLLVALRKYSWLRAYMDWKVRMVLKLRSFYRELRN